MLITFHPMDQNLLILLFSIKLKELVDKWIKCLVGLSVTFKLSFSAVDLCFLSVKNYHQLATNWKKTISINIYKIWMNDQLQLKYHTYVSWCWWVKRNSKNVSYQFCQERIEETLKWKLLEFYSRTKYIINITLLSDNYIFLKRLNYLV